MAYGLSTRAFIEDGPVDQVARVDAGRSTARHRSGALRFHADAEGVLIGKERNAPAPPKGPKYKRDFQVEPG